MFPHPDHRGFTLIELMVSISVLAVLMAIATPSMQEVLMNSGATAQGNSLIGSLNNARSEAVKTGVAVRLTPVGGSWNNGWVVATDRNANGTLDAGDGDAIIEEHDKAEHGFLWTAATQPGAGAVTRVTYAPTGMLTPSTAGLLFKLKRPDATAHPERCRLVFVEAGGRVEGQKGSASKCA